MKARKEREKENERYGRVEEIEYVRMNANGCLTEREKHTERESESVSSLYRCLRARWKGRER